MGQFDKFKKKEATGARKKEMLKQDKRNTKAESAAYFKEKRNASKPVRPTGTTEDGKPIGRPTAPEMPGQTPGVAIKPSTEIMPLNKYIAHGGICSRRDAAALVKQGVVQVNGTTQTDPGYKVLPTDEVKVNGKKVIPKSQLVYILLNKPKDFITTADDDKGRKTVLDIVKNATTERIFPVGRLDRNTTGVLLLTNDGDLTQHLTHPSFEVRKIYEATLDKVVQKADLEKLVAGITLEDGFIAADAAGYADPIDKSVVGIEIHSGKNRVVRRMFEKLGYDVKSLDRVMFANLTKKNVDRGKWRFLSEKEIRLLKFFNKSKRKAKPGTEELQDTPFMGKSSKPAAGKRFNKSSGERSEKSFGRKEVANTDKPYNRTERTETARPERSESERPFNKSPRSGSERPFNKTEGQQTGRSDHSRSEKSYDRNERTGSGRPSRPEQPASDRPYRKPAKPTSDRPFDRNDRNESDRPTRPERPGSDRPYSKPWPGFERPYGKREGSVADRPSGSGEGQRFEKPFNRPDGPRPGNAAGRKDRDSTGTNDKKTSDKTPSDASSPKRAPRKRIHLKK